ncbi:MAG TPA: DUF4070 domain-containing protein, partial [Microcoleaceae cyanobacterium]
RLRKVSWVSIRALLTVCWRQGVVRKTRWKFWLNLIGILRHNPAVWQHYLAICALGEHFLEYRQIVRDQIETQLADYLATESPRVLAPSDSIVRPLAS